MQVQRLDKGSQPPFSPVLERELRLMELLLISLSCPKVAASVRGGQLINVVLIE
jgi:hypothetical protein